MKYEVYGTLVSGSGVFQAKRHDYPLEQSHEARAVECRFVDVLFSHENLVVTSIPVQEANHFVP
jgi:hypothetical protein